MPPDVSLWTQNLQQGALDFDKFLDSFFEEFPELEGRPIHFAGESFGGKYVPVYVSMMRREFASIILIDALIDMPDTILGLYGHLCALPKLSRSPAKLNETACKAMGQDYPLCAKMSDLCKSTYDLDVCRTAVATCMETVGRWYLHEVQHNGWNPNDDRLRCEEPSLCGNMGTYGASRFTFLGLKHCNL